MEEFPGEDAGGRIPSKISSGDDGDEDIEEGHLKYFR